ncbi:hypothetical protein I7I50_10539 [Histoplasma capsulatum G186AR]|uniref:Secreted protein n=1 Tax=Ajellomyces capsulatus TaxID=5037 RepID=A0A8H7Z3X5_AJECA|nr:hypothetical protein I7I52_01778 [Histoplasma capsulatum]QSS69295.1 hypothetical protein I7I50_10539 [Histoplasma capsulatum G186AR]
MGSLHRSFWAFILLWETISEDRYHQLRGRDLQASGSPAAASRLDHGLPGCLRLVYRRNAARPSLKSLKRPTRYAGTAQTA